MAKIHVKGGSPLKLEFEDDKGESRKVRLERVNKKDEPPFEYHVIDDISKERLQTFRGPRNNFFMETNPNEKWCEISYKGTKPSATV